MFKSILKTASLIAMGALLAACMSRAPEPVAEPSPSDGEIVVTGRRDEDAASKRTRTSEAAPMSPSPVMAPPESGSVISDVASSAPPPGEPSTGPAVPVQAGTLTAGDYDDVLNPALYAAYLEGKREDWDLGEKDLPYVDADRRIEVKITDRLGKPYPFATLQLATPGGKDMFSLTTGANGVVYLYPRFDALEAGTRLRVGAQANRPNATGAITSAQLEKGGTLTLTLPEDAPKVTKLDVLLTLDATGSMTDEMGYLQAELDSIFRRLKSKYPAVDLRAGLIVYRDHGDEYVTRTWEFTGTLDDFRKRLAEQTAYDGGDTPEAMNEAMKAGLNFKWRSDAVKINLLVADAPPHDGDIDATWNAALQSRVEGIHIVPVAASGVDPTAEFLMRAMAQVTQGRYLFLTDDSGVGNAHAAPEVDCYVVTRLNGLVERVMVSLLTGQRVEPEGSDVIRTVGNYKAGVCKVDRVQ